ncbi:MAG: hypothetical protein AAF196_00595 [Planctomycetota bacterium]
MTEATPDRPQPFGAKMGWLAVRSSEPREVANTLKIESLQPSSWSHGIRAVYEDSDAIFVTPAIEGWTMVAGFGLGLELEEVDGRWRHELERLSERFGDAQHFATHRVAEFHGWARATNGEIRRAFAYLGESGEILFDEGPRSDAELELGFDLAELPSDCDEDPDPVDNTPSEESVFSLARSWSTCPMDLEDSSATPSLGWLRHIPRTVPPSPPPQAARRPWWRLW